MKNEKNVIAVINGPNINILGNRESDIYGIETWDNIEKKLRTVAEELNVEIVFFQSNYEGKIVDYLQQKLNTIDGIVLNPAAFTKTGYAILDAISAKNIPFVEVHLSNIFSRGGWHAETIFAEKAIGHINGFKGIVYHMGLWAICDYIKMNETKCEKN